VIGRIIEVADDHRHLFLSRGFMVVQDSANEKKELGQVPIDDIAAVIANAHGMTYTNNLLVALAERCAPFVLCAANHNVAGMLLPVDGNFQQAKRFDAQIEATKPQSKRLWAEIVKAKLAQQAAALEAVGAPTAPLLTLIRQVRSGDPENIEAQGARRYWTLLFGDDFRRDRDAGGINGLLNYGYAVLRSCTARATVAAGLHPTLGLHHSNEGNAMRLVDDLMEPFRPTVDLRAYQLAKAGTPNVTPDTKRALVRVMYDDMQTEAGVTPVMSCINRLATSLAQVFLGERTSLELPLPGLPLALAAQSRDDRSAH
jgi:CRISPR-associated protein Cas1